MATPHNTAAPGDIAKTVLMPGDPLRAKFIAEHFLENAVCYNEVRGMYGYTGTYHGVRISVQGSGMGMPSMGIYSYELYHEYQVERILRIGLSGTFAPIASYALLETAVQTARQLELPVHVGNLFSTDVFYREPSPLPQWAKMGVLATEMEAAALYLNAAAAGREALCITTISDCPLRGESTSPEERQPAFTDMMRLALETATK